MKSRNAKTKFNTYDNFGRAINLDGLGMPYSPISESCNSLQVDVPDSMGFETHEALKKVNKNVGGSTVQFVADRLNYGSTSELCSALAAEQIDAAALAIYNIEAYGEGIIIGDQTGIGKGRQAAAIIRYAVENGMKPIFITEKPNLFSDIYRDLIAIGNKHYVPFIINGKESKTNVKDEDGNVIYEAWEPNRQKEVFKSGKVPASCHFVMATYSQFNSPEKKPEKPIFLQQIAENNIIIFDEAHNASGSSQTGEFLKNVVRSSKGVLFLSATFAKRPDNMPIYAIRTAMQESNMSNEDLTDSITRGGVALQEILASQLVKEGQMLRRERTYEGIEVNYITMTEKEAEHKRISDNLTEIMRDIIWFQGEYVEGAVKTMNKLAAAKQSNVEQRKGTQKGGVDNMPYFSKVFNVINQMLFSIKAKEVADRALVRLKQGKSVVIAFASTMESFLDDMGASEGEVINTDFSLVLKKGLDAVLRITIKDEIGNSTYQTLNPLEISKECQQDYLKIYDKIKKLSSGISISPIDVIKGILQDKGYKVAEVTGRKTELQMNLKNNTGLVMSRKKLNVNDAFRMFNNNEADVLMINQSGSTGASAHAVPTKKVSPDQVKQRCMIVLQPELDINREVQKRGRVNRTGQILKPIYDYVSTAIPAEQRLMMMLQRKLKSLDANTTSNQKQSSAILSVPDFLNKIGDKIVVEFLLENQDMNKLIDDPLGLIKKTAEETGTQSEDENETKEDAAMRVSGRIAILSTQMQQKFYDEIITRYNDQVEYLKNIGEYDLEVDTLNLEAITKQKDVTIVGKGGRSEFGTNSYLEKCECNVLRKPYKKDEVEKLLKETLKGTSASDLLADIFNEYENFNANVLKRDLDKLEKDFKKRIDELSNRKDVKAIKGHGEQMQYVAALTKELTEAYNEEVVMERKINANKYEDLSSLINYFFAGRGVYFPEMGSEGHLIKVPAVCLGIIIDKKRQNPYAPSAVKFRFAITNSKKYLVISASGDQGHKLRSIIASSIDLTDKEGDKILTNWKELCENANANRNIRYIVTGNILQAFSTYKGTLVSYTTSKGETKKGILMPEAWRPAQGVKENFVNVPIKQALNQILKMASGNEMKMSNPAISLVKNYNNTYTLYVPGSRSKFGSIFLDSDLLKYATGNNFNSASGMMKGIFNNNDITEVVNILSDKHQLSVSVHINTIDQKSLEQDSSYAPEEIKLLPRKKIPVVTPGGNLQMFEFEAEAIALELELLNLN